MDAYQKKKRAQSWEKEGRPSSRSSESYARPTTSSLGQRATCWVKHPPPHTNLQQLIHSFFAKQVY